MAAEGDTPLLFDTTTHGLSIVPLMLSQKAEAYMETWKLQFGFGVNASEADMRGPSRMT
jgi:hypothetical protein